MAVEDQGIIVHIPLVPLVVVLPMEVMEETEFHLILVVQTTPDLAVAVAAVDQVVLMEKLVIFLHFSVSIVLMVVLEKMIQLGASMPVVAVVVVITLCLVEVVVVQVEVEMVHYQIMILQEMDPLTLVVVVEEGLRDGRPVELVQVVVVVLGCLILYMQLQQLAIHQFMALAAGVESPKWCFPPTCSTAFSS